MIPSLSLMIGAYIITRMIELLLNKETKQFAGLCAIITIIACLYALFDIFSAGMNISNMPSL